MPIDLVAGALARPARPISWALKDLVNCDEATYMTQMPNLSDSNQRRIDFLHDNDLYELPNHERPDCHKEGHTYPSVYGRLDWNDVAPTITTGFFTPGRGRFIHPLLRRTLSAREAARLQGFPDSYRFDDGLTEPARTALARAIGDAVPSPLGFAATIAALGNR
jgi:DNA (cytosine-5)-methyltransferase 1